MSLRNRDDWFLDPPTAEVDDSGFPERDYDDENELRWEHEQEGGS